MKELEDAAEELANRHQPGTKEVDAGNTYREHWASLDKTGRHAFLVANGVKVTVVRDDHPEMLDIMTVVPDSTGLVQAPESAGLRPGEGATSVRVGKHRAFIWLGNLEKLRQAARSV